MATITSYSFTQQVDYPSVLIASIQASSISTPFNYLETDGSGPTMSVLVWFSDILSDADQETLNSVMVAYVNSLPALQVAVTQIKKDMAFGAQIIAEFGAANRINNLSAAQVAQIAQQLLPIQLLLNSGSIATALYAIQSITPNALITQDVINHYSGELQNYLNNPT